MMAKRVLSLLLAVVMMISLTGCAADIAGGVFFLSLIAAGDDGAEKEEIFEFVREQESELLRAVENGDFSAFENKGLIQKINADDGCVDFYCGGGGIAPSGYYAGFYYTPDNDMTAMWCAPASADALLPCGDGFEWREQNGDNLYYTEHICGNFYYYKASF